ncbi:malate dehydrogenase [Vescimonas coprocola]|uniref:Malate dehydrogenase n=1 Tax=Vescimonas coprocola TaxID=2714355 RepID=A0A810Q2W5_9FIRM|nr:NADP-dependent malic enzyme [Vescimonas coprocola]BCK82668.1 malate dehydrogenase [Vescimonas coprocola]
MSTLKEEALQLHEVHQGKLAVSLKVDIETKHDLSLAYTPGVAEPCLEIAQDREQVYRYTGKGNAVAIVTDGTAVLGLGDIGPEAALPVMEGKACLFKRFGGVDAYPICLNTKDPEEIVRAVQLIAPGFGGINLEDISAPRCFEIEERLIETLDIPVFHDDQHGTAVVVLAALINGAKCLGLELPQVQTVISGAGAAGISVCKLLMKAGVRDITLCDRQGAIWEGREGLNGAKTAMAKVTNRAMRKGSLAEVMEGADLFIGVSGPGIVTQEMVRSMSPQAMVFALSNPVPEIMPELALAAGAKVVATGRSDFPNQINNLLVFPGIFKGALAARASRITEEMMIAAAYAIAGRVSPEELSRECIIPSTFDMGVADVVAEAVKAHVEH